MLLSDERLGVFWHVTWHLRPGIARVDPGKLIDMLNFGKVIVGRMARVVVPDAADFTRSSFRFWGAPPFDCWAKSVTLV